MKNWIVALLLLSAITSSYGEFYNDSEVSVLVTGGNSLVEVYNAKTKNVYKANSQLYKFGGHYTLGSSDNEISTRNWDLNVRFEKILNERYSIFIGEILEGDKFTGIYTRYNTDLGMIYHIIKKKNIIWFLEAGYRFTREKVISTKTRSESKARLYSEVSKRFKPGLWGKFWLEYIPNLTDSDDWLLNFEGSLSVAMSTNFALKLAYVGNYDDRPAVTGDKKFDYLYTFGLLAKF